MWGQIGVDLKNGWTLTTDSRALPLPIPAFDQNGLAWAMGQAGELTMYSAQHDAYAADSHPFADTTIGGDSYDLSGYQIWSKEGDSGSVTESLFLTSSYSFDLTAGGLGSPEGEAFIDTHLGFASTRIPSGTEVSFSVCGSIELSDNSFRGLIYSALVNSGVPATTDSKINLSGQISLK